MSPKIKYDQCHTDTDENVCHIEDRPDAEVEEVHHAADTHTVDGISQSPSEQHTDRGGKIAGLFRDALPEEEERAKEQDDDRKEKPSLIRQDAEGRAGRVGEDGEAAGAGDRRDRAVDLRTGRPAEVSVTGRHDACIALRVPVIVEAAAAIVLVDLMALSGRLAPVLPSPSSSLAPAAPSRR